MVGQYEPTFHLVTDKFRLIFVKSHRLAYSCQMFARWGCKALQITTERNIFHVLMALERFIQ